MKTRILITTALACCFVVCLAAVIADANGKWKGAITGPDGNIIDLNYLFKIDGDKLTGTAQAQGFELKLDCGRISGSDFKFCITNPQGIIIPHSGKYFTNGDSISMNITYQDMKFHSTLTRAVAK